MLFAFNNTEEKWKLNRIESILGGMAFFVFVSNWFIARFHGGRSSTQILPLWVAWWKIEPPRRVHVCIWYSKSQRLLRADGIRTTLFNRQEKCVIYSIALTGRWKKAKGCIAKLKNIAMWKDATGYSYRMLTREASEAICIWTSTADDLIDFVDRHEIYDGETGNLENRNRVRKSRANTSKKSENYLMRASILIINRWSSSAKNSQVIWSWCDCYWCKIKWMRWETAVHYAQFGPWTHWAG